MKIFLSFSPALRFNLAALFVAGLCFWAGLAGLLPILPLFIETLGASGQQIGIVMASFALGLLLARPRLSRLADERGRKLVLLIGIGAIALAPLGYLSIKVLPHTVLSLPWGSQQVTLDVSLLAIMAIRAFHGLSIAAFVVAYSALIVDISPPQNRGELIGYMSLVNPVGLALGPALGGFLLEGTGFEVAFLAMGILGLIGLLCCLGVKETYQPRPRSLGNTEEPHPFWRLLWTPRVRTPAIILLMVGLAFGTLTTFVPLYMRESGVSLNVGLIYTASALASFTIRILVGRASDRHGRGRFITLSLALYTLAMAIFWWADSASWFLLAGLVQGMAAGTLIPMIAALMGDRSESDERGRVFGLAMVGFDVGIALAGPTFGGIADAIGYRGIFGLAALMTLIGLGVFVTASSKDLPHSLRFALGRGRDVYAVDPYVAGK
ncbi:putative MFS-type transporter YwoG [Halomicronema hongdechloris C2206]|uniref:MFS-type transporter YwoG n=1 Tax=Halomicronema hongdechloris C2206 TaxID=1641165 RepID=A0A1Z3HG82_9CYAN|nr:MFS transporter [Halomicronema hongdechloris]ASC69237.1 putative MFS-type transporter YwoG [Halomicronema hongdechloris C2206]